MPSRYRRSLAAIALTVAALAAPAPLLGADATTDLRTVRGQLLLGAAESFDATHDDRSIEGADAAGSDLAAKAFIDDGSRLQEVVLVPGQDVEALRGRQVRGQGRQVGDRVVLATLAADLPRPGTSTGGGESTGTFDPATATGSVSAAGAVVAGATRTVAIINFNFANDRRVPYSNAAVAATAFGGSRSMAGYYAEVTRGQLRVTGAVFGWYTIPASNAGCQLTTWANQARRAAERHGVDLSQYGYVMYSFPRVSGCAFGGMALVGGRSSWLNGYGTSVYVASHELGHNFGLWHARATRCVNASGARVTLSGRCTTSEYGDLFDIMGSTSRQLSATHRRGIGALPSSAIRVVTSTQTLILARAGSEAGIRLVRIPRSSAPGQYFDLEFRPNAGTFDQFGSASTNRGVLVRLDTTYTAATSLLDMTPSTASFADAALVSGRAWKHSIDRVTIGVGAVTTSGIKVTITFGADRNPPSAPGNLTATSTSTSVALRWSPAWDNVAVVGYRLDRDGSHIATLPGTATTFTDANRRPETTYRYALRALDAAGHLGPATTVTATTLPPDLNPPSAPDWLRATAGEASVWLGWGAASDAEGGLRGYRISRDGSVVATTGAATRSWTDGSRRPGTYVYAVAAIDLAGNVGPALTRTVTVLGPDSSAPTVPGSLVVTAGATSATLRWTSADDDVGVTGYTIWRGGVVVATVASWARSWRDADLAPGVYEYAVAAFDEAGNIGPARIGAATVLGPDATPPSAPAALRLDDVRRRSVRLAWEPATDDVGVVLYRVYRDGRLVDVTYGTSAWDRPGAGTYSYTVTAVDAAGNESPPSVPLEIQLGG